MVIKTVIGIKNGKSYQKELSREESEAFYGKALGDTVKGELFSLQGTEFVITGGSDYCGFPMRKDLPGTKRKKILMGKGIGFKGKLRKKRFGGLRVKKTVAGNTVHEKTHQLNLKCVKGEDIVKNTFKVEKPEENKKEDN
jgi:small subunit ribosomal protein S6e